MTVQDRSRQDESVVSDNRVRHHQRDHLYVDHIYSRHRKYKKRGQARSRGDTQGRVTAPLSGCVGTQLAHNEKNAALDAILPYNMCTLLLLYG